MALFHLPLRLNKRISFYKLMGSGKNGTFDKVPDWQQWAILSVGSGATIDMDAPAAHLSKQLYGSFIAGWFRLFGCEQYSILMQAIESHGVWDGKKVFGNLPAKSDYEGPVGILTRATIRLNKLNYFWQNVAPVAQQMGAAKGFLFSAGVGEIPWVKQATFSVWQTKEDMKAFAYGMKAHTEVIQKTRKQNWYSEDMFTRFKILHTSGSIKGENPLRELRMMIYDPDSYREGDE
ncbi:MAG: spheroidene monooxygenase [Chitinophagaceae bacterium]|nr:MAG: spheroidene monooxygenase [Chitinophagaceae bacterium]